MLEVRQLSRIGDMNLRDRLLVFAICLFCVFATDSYAAKKYALLVAIEDYSKVEGAHDLQGCATDLRDLDRLLRTQYQFPPENITVLLDSKATTANLMNSLSQYTKKILPGDTFVFYFSGHGGQVPDLYDSDETLDGEDEVFVTYDYKRLDHSTWLLDDHLRYAISKLKTRRTLVLVDACHSGTASRSGYTIKRANLGFTKFFNPGGAENDPFDAFSRNGTPPANHIFISSCAANEVSNLGSFRGARRSIFTTAFIAAAKRDSAKTLSDFNVTLRKEMKDLSPEIAARQNPQLETSLVASLQDILDPTTPHADLEAESDDFAEFRKNQDSDFRVEVSTNKKHFIVGDQLVASVISEKSGYLRLYYVDKDGCANIIFPNHFQKEGTIEAGERIDIGTTECPFKLLIEGPKSTELLVAVVSTEPFSDDDLLELSAEKPFKTIGKVDSLQSLVSRGWKGIAVEERVAELARATTLYDINLESE